MTESYLTNPIVFLVHTVFGLYTAVVVLRFLLQWARADFYNPLSQFVVKLTTPVLRPLRRVIPGYGGIDLASLTLAWLLKSAELAIVALVAGMGRNLLGALGWAVPALVRMASALILARPCRIFLKICLDLAARPARVQARAGAVVAPGRTAATICATIWKSRWMKPITAKMPRSACRPP